MELKPIVCPSCGGTIQLPSEKKACFCSFCGAQLLIDDGSRTVTFRTVDEARLREIDLESRRMTLEESRRPGRVKTMIILAVIGMAMMLIGQFAGHASGDSNSPWYMVAILGLFPLCAVAYIWIDSRASEDKGDRS